MKADHRRCGHKRAFSEAQWHHKQAMRHLWSIFCQRRLCRIFLVAFSVLSIYRENRVKHLLPLHMVDLPSMPKVARPPNPCLVGIALIVKSRAGPRLVYHYPPDPCADNSHQHGWTKDISKANGLDDELSGEDGHETDLDSDEALNHEARYGERSANQSTLSENASRASTQGYSDGRRSRKQSPLHVLTGNFASGSTSRTSHRRKDNEHDSLRTDSVHGRKDVLWDTFFGLRTDVWANLLSPAESFQKRKFEVAFNDLAFVGWPVFAKGDGTWGKCRRKTRQGPVRPDNNEPSPMVSELSLLAGKRHPGKDDEELLEDRDEDEMTMFNVVFILNPPKMHYRHRVGDQYTNVIRKFGKGLKSEQARVGFVWKQAQLIMAIKERARDLGSSTEEVYANLRLKSSLVRAIETIYWSISKSQIASVTLTPEASMSLQIPPITSTSYLPTPMEPEYRGLWLTSANSDTTSELNAKGGSVSEPTNILAKHFALLLLADEGDIIHDLDMSNSLGPRIAHFIRVSKPNKSFAQVSSLSGIPMTVIQVLANHLIYWRRARAIPPLNQQDTYIVSPNADLRNLSRAAKEYSTTFTTSPSLPKMLSMLSGNPIPYSMLRPSKDHKALYYSILAWLLRGGWVTQLRSFAWIKATPHVKLKTQEDLYLRKSSFSSFNAEKLQEFRETRKAEEDEARPSTFAGLETIKERYDFDSLSRVPTLTSETSRGTELSPKYMPEDDDPEDMTSPVSPTISSMFQRTQTLHSSLIQQPQQASPTASKWLDFIASQFPPEPQRAGSIMSNFSALDFSPPNNIDSVHGGLSKINVPDQNSSPIDIIQYQLNNAKGASGNWLMSEYWPIFKNYFNGSEPLESIAVREGHKRSFVRRVIAMIDQGITLEPSAPQSREKVLVTVRHW